MSRGLKQCGRRNGKKLWKARLYWIDQRDGKHRDRVVTFEAASKALAVVERARQLEAARNETDPRAKDRRRFGAVASEWLATVESYGSHISYGSHVRKLTKRYGQQFVDAFTRRELQAYLDALPLAPGTVNSIRDVLKHVFRYAVRRGYCEGNPAAETERRSTRPTRSQALEDAPRRALTESEAVALLSWFQRHAEAFYPLAAAQFVLGCRFGEVSSLEWGDIDMTTGIVTIRRAQVRGRVGPTKGRYARTAALGPDGLALITAHRATMEREQWPGFDVLVFPRPPTTRKRHSEHWSISTAWHVYKRGLLAIGLDLPVASHTARHTMLTVAQTFASARLLRAVGGHKTEAVQAGYLGTQPSEVVELGARVGSRFLAQTGSQTGTKKKAAKRKAQE
jgi:integrase